MGAVISKPDVSSVQLAGPAAVETYRELHYHGNLVDDVVGLVMGPTVHGELLYCYHADYDIERDRTTAYFRYATVKDVEGLSNVKSNA